MRAYPIVIFISVVLLAAVSASAQFGFAGPKIEHSAAVAPQADGTLRVAIKFAMDKAWHMNSHTPLEDYLIPTVLELGETPGVSLVSTVYPAHKEVKFEFSPTPLAVYEDTFSVGAVLKADGPLPASLPFTLNYQACNDKQCAPPNTLELTVATGAAATPEAQALIDGVDWSKAAAVSTEAAPPAEEAAAPTPAEAAPPAVPWQQLIQDFEIASQTGYSSKADFLSFIRQGKGQEAASTGFWGAVKGGDFGTLSTPMLILVVLLGGLALNLTPCVLPLIPINIGIIGAGARAGSKARGFALGGAFGLGIAASYGALGLLVVLGLSTAFGGFNSTVWFNAGISVFFVLLGLAMFDVINIDFSKYQAKVGIRSNKGGSFAVAFFMGVVSALLAGACVAPVVIYTILYAQGLYTQGNAFALALPFLLGVGMGLPWPFAGGGLSFLPKPGAWMTRVKQGFGVFIIAFAAWYAHIAWGIYDQKNVDPEAVRASVEAQGHEGWETTLEAALTKAKEEGKPVFVDFWATWCKNCLVMNETVLADAEVLKELEDVVKVKYQAEDPATSPVKEVWEHFKLVGLPAYFILTPKS